MFREAFLILPNREAVGGKKDRGMGNMSMWKGGRLAWRPMDGAKKLVVRRHFAPSPNRTGLQPCAVFAQREEINNLSVRLATSFIDSSFPDASSAPARNLNEEQRWQQETETENDKMKAARQSWGDLVDYISLLRPRSAVKYCGQ